MLLIHNAIQQYDRDKEKYSNQLDNKTHIKRENGKMRGIGTECPVIAKTVILRKNSAFLSVMIKFSLELQFVDKADPHMII